MKFELSLFNKNIKNTDLIQDLKKIHNLLKGNKISLTFRSYNDYGKYSSATLAARFGSWNNALLEANLVVNEEKNIEDKDLFLNLESVWTALGRQPTYRDLKIPLSKYVSHTYTKRFGCWHNALKAFISYINENEGSKKMNDEIKSSKVAGETTQLHIKSHHTNRNISDRMRFRILFRDGFICQACGASPLKSREVELHVDHIVPWSKGGETIEENLQTKCKRCNLGKGNLFNK